MYEKAAAVGLALFYLSDPSQAQSLDIKSHLHALDKAATCADMLKRSNGRIYDFSDVELRRSDIHKSKTMLKMQETPLGPIQLPVTIVGYVKVTDPARIKEVEANRAKYQGKEWSRYEAEADYIEGTVNALTSEYVTRGTQKALDALIAEHEGEDTALEALRIPYRNLAEVSVFNRLTKGEDLHAENTLTEFFSGIGAFEYSKLAKELDQDALIQHAYSHILEWELDKMDLFAHYRAEKSEQLRSELKSHGDLVSLFTKAYERTKTGEGTLEYNLRQDSVFAKLLDLFPAERLNGPHGLLDYRIIDMDIKNATRLVKYGQNGTIDYVREPILLLIGRNQYIDHVMKMFDSEDTKADVRVSLKARLGCVWEADLIEKGQRMRADLNHKLAANKGKVSLDVRVVSELMARMESNRPYYPSGRILYFDVRELKALPKLEPMVLSSPSKR